MYNNHPNARPVAHKPSIAKPKTRYSEKTYPVVIVRKAFSQSKAA